MYKIFFHMEYTPVSRNSPVTEFYELPTIVNTLGRFAYEAVRQRIDIYCVLSHLDWAETAQYIPSHLTYADGRQGFFTKKTLSDIYKESAEIPRRINRICEKSLMYASSANT